MTGEYTFVGTASLETLSRVHDLFTKARRGIVDGDEIDLAMLETATIELVGNVIEHGRRRSDTTCVVRLRVEQDFCEAVLVDSGAKLPMSPGEATLPDELNESGRGLVLARKAVDSLTYRYANGSNRWRLIRARRSSAPPP